MISFFSGAVIYCFDKLAYRRALSGKNAWECPPIGEF
jgi:hypothetical protein